MTNAEYGFQVWFDFRDPNATPASSEEATADEPVTVETAPTPSDYEQPGFETWGVP